jgi:guanylate kinase
LIISGPSGCGKTTLISHLLTLYPKNFELSVSHTTRNKRAQEKEGFHYYYVAKENFESRIKNNDFLEFEEVHGKFYGTSKNEITRILAKSKIPLLDIDIKGAINIHKNCRIQDANYLFIMTKEIKTLEQRLISRGTENPETLKIRIKNARDEIKLAKESNIYGEKNYIYNDEDLDSSKNEFTIKIQELYGNLLKV